MDHRVLEQVDDVASRSKTCFGSREGRGAFMAEAMHGSPSMMGDLSSFLEGIRPLPASDRGIIVEQALVLLEACYAHLPLKRSMHAVDPVQRLRLLLHRLDGGGGPRGPSFHNEMTQIFNSIRDVHTNYLLPSPYCRLTAHLPFLIEEYYDEQKRRRYVVSKVLGDLEHPTFKVGAEVLYWNGTPIDRAVERNSERLAGSNPDASHARGLDSMTIRPMVRVLPPDEEWVTITYRTEGGAVEELRLSWEILSPGMGHAAVDPNKLSAASVALGLDIQTDAVHQAKKALYAAEAVEAEQRVASGEPSEVQLASGLPTSMPTVLRAKAVSTQHGTFGYIRIFTFNVTRADGFVDEFIRLAEALPEDGLIIDVRGNGGGLIPASEQLLQTLTPRKIEPARFQFINTPLMLDLCTSCSGPGHPPGLDLSPWAASIAEAVKTGATYSRAVPMSDPDLCNTVGQKVHGPVVLITDALCYSATDLFAAGFQDHEVGPILGCSANTGAGGANVWTHGLLCQLLHALEPRVSPLPGDAGMSVAIRRSLRVGTRAGTPLEDLGVVPDGIHRMTRRDVLGSNEDLIDHAAKLLTRGISYRLRVGLGPRRKSGIDLTLITRNLGTVDVYVDGHPSCSVPVHDGETALSVGLPSDGENHLEFKAFDADDALRAARKERI